MAEEMEAAMAGADTDLVGEAVVDMQVAECISGPNQKYQILGALGLAAMGLRLCQWHHRISQILGAKGVPIMGFCKWRCISQILGAMGLCQRGCISGAMEPITLGTIEPLPRSMLPLRVVDLSATLSSEGAVCFKVPCDWNFHIISHTWSEGLLCFSERIKQQVRNYLSFADLRDVTDPYRWALELATFSEEPCYQKLLEFLNVLATDGVKLVWMDTLCINQMDIKEKSREIANMGEYYKCSQGCYASTHGVDQGFQLWSDDQDPVPRWFSRAWTLQEFLLPSIFTFIVTGLHPTTVQLVNYVIEQSHVDPGGPALDVDQQAYECALAQRPKSVGYCKCTLRQLDSSLDLPKPDNSQMQYVDLKEIITSDERCPKCGTILIRKVATAKEDVADTLYFVDREAFFSLMRTETLVHASLQLDNSISRAYDVAGSRYGRFGRYGGEVRAFLETRSWPAFKVVSEIAVRNCSLEEDRVLSILGLLPVKDSREVQAGKTLDEQIAGLAKLLCDEDALIELCALDAKAYGSTGMSWAPDFSTTKHRIYGWQNMLNDFEKSVVVKEVTAAGKIRLGGKVAQVRLRLPTLESAYYTEVSLGYGDDPQSLQWEEKFSRGEVQLHRSSSNMELELIIEFVGSNFNTGEVRLALAVEGSSSFLSSSDWIEVDSWWLFLGACKHLEGEPSQRNLVMVCIKRDEELHKIGVVRLGSSTRDRLFGQGADTLDDCLVGGFGQDFKYTSHSVHPNSVHPSFHCTHKFTRPMTQKAASLKLNTQLRDYKLADQRQIRQTEKRSEVSAIQAIFRDLQVPKQA